MVITLSQLYIHPVKSMRGLQLSHAQASSSGLAFDRIFMVTESDGRFITARNNPQMVLFTPALTIDGLFLTAPDGDSINIRFSDFLSNSASTEVWSNHFTAVVAPDAVNSWLSHYFQRAVQLCWLGQKLTRRVKNQPEMPLSFADGYPYLLINEASFQALQQICPSRIKLEQFRPNIAVNGADAFAEDSWQVIRIGEVIFDLVKPCSRCILTTVSTQRGRIHPRGEPLSTLQKFRTAENGDVDFGQNMIARNTGVIRVGDNIEILATKSPRIYSAGEVAVTIVAPESQTKTVTIEFNGISFTGNNQQVLLEQLEQQGFRIPYSCRAGICGSCNVRIINGEVAPLKQSAIVDKDNILSCSCIPKGNVSLSDK